MSESTPLQPRPPVSKSQSSIRSFFKPRSPIYTAVPSTSSSSSTSSPSITGSKSPLTPPILSPASSLLAEASLTPLTSPPHPPTSFPPSTAPSRLTRPPTTKPLPQQATILPIAAAHITPLKRINALLLPIAYPASFYTHILTPPPSQPTYANFSRAILWSPKPGIPPTVIGGLVARVEIPLHDDGKEGTLYVQSLALLSPYRGLGLAGRVLEDIVQAVIEHNNAVEDGEDEGGDANGSAPGHGKPKITSLYAHVWTENSDALEWYRARGFVVDGGVVDGYYRKLNPDTAVMMRRHLGVNDHLRHGASRATSANSAPPPPAIAANGDVGKDDGGTAPSRPPPPPRKNAADPMAKSFMSAKRADSEWNDLPEDILVPKPAPRSGQPSRSPSRDPSASSSRVNLNLTDLAGPTETEAATRKGASTSDTLAPPPAMGSGPPSRTGTPGAGLVDVSGSGAESGESSRSSSALGMGAGVGRKKNPKGKRAYPAAAFSVVGNGNGNGHGHAAEAGPPK